VYPAYGRRLARSIHQTVAPVAAAVAGLPGVPARVRMVPVGTAACGAGEVQVGEPWVREPSTLSDQQIRSFYVGLYLACTLGWGPEAGHRQGDPRLGEDAKVAVDLWARLTGGYLTSEELQQPHGSENGLGSPAAITAALAMAELPSGQVRTELAPVWERLRAGTLPLSELPGQGP
jgi:hypothetical protein